MAKNRSLLDFVQKCSEKNNDFDFYNIKNSMEVQKLNEAFNESDNITEKLDLVPSKFKAIGKGKRCGIECNIPTANITDMHHFKEDLDNWGFIVTKHGKHSTISTNLNKLNKKGEDK